MRLNVLYQSSDQYAPLTGISMTSLFENNKDIETIKIYLLDDGISDKNLKLIKKTVNKYGRMLDIIETQAIKELLISLGVAPFKGTYTTYFKLFVSKYIEDIEDVQYLLYMDSDTLVDGNISGVLNTDLKGKIAAARVDLVPKEYKRALDMDTKLPYYNCGVILFNMSEWIKQDCEKIIITSIREDRTKYSLADQDLLCTLFSDRFCFLGLEYNFPSMLYIFSPEECYKVYDLDEESFHSIKEMKEAYKHPIIQHTLTHFGKRPWHHKSGHPQEEVFFKYVARSEWKNYEKQDGKRSLIFVLQEICYKILPKSIYMMLHKKMLKVYLKQRDKSYLRENRRGNNR